MSADATSAAPAESAEPAEAASSARPKGRRKPLLWLTIAVVAASGTGYWYLSQDSSADPSTETAGPVATAAVSEQDLAATESWPGKLGHGKPFQIKAKGQGTLTDILDQNERVKRGTELYRLDETPVVALIGRLPMYRDLASGAEGADVKQLEQNLAKLGYEGFTVDDEFTWYTAAAVKEWQEDLGIDETGAVGEPDVVFVPRSGQVDGVQAALGDEITPGTEVVGVSSSDQIVSLEVDVADRDLVDVDTEVAVRLPGGEEVIGTVTGASVVEDTSGGDDGGGGGGDEEDPGADDTITQVEVTLENKVDEALQGSPADVVVDVESREGVLVVPVTALLALAEGGFGLEVVNKDGTTTIVAVAAGLFADGMVEVAGDGIAKGTVVGVAGR